MGTTPLTARGRLGWWQGRQRLAMALVNVIAGPFAVMALGLLVAWALRSRVTAFDFQHAYWQSGHRVLVGASPYAWSVAQFHLRFVFVYPALSAVMFAPLSLLPRSFGVVLFTFVSVALLPAALWVLRVRDWRVYGMATLWEPFFYGWLTANQSLYLMFGLACVWRVRDRPRLAGLLAGALMSLEPLLWPLGLWLVATRRWRASLYALVWGVALNLVAWGIVGFGQIGPYLHASATLTGEAWRTGFGIPALVGRLGVGWHVGLAALVLVSTALAVALIRSGWRRRSDHHALVLTVALALVSSPLLWSHYVMLLLVPLALLRPRLDWPWAVPVVFWASQLPTVPQDWQLVVDWVGIVVMLVAVARAGRRISSRGLMPAVAASG